MASLADGDTHLADRSGDVLVTAQCDGRQFRPLAALTTAPPDQAQTCLACRGNHRPGAVRTQHPSRNGGVAR